MHMLSSIADMGPPFYTPTVYTADFWSPLLTTLYLAGIGSLSWMLQRRTPAWGTWGKLSMARGVIVVLLLDSFCFVFSAALFTLGVGTSRNRASCGVAIWFCIIFYASTKFFITVFLIERLHLVLGGMKTRRESKLYMSNCAIAALWVGLFIALIAKNHTTLRSDHQCVFTLSHQALSAAGALDIFSNAYFSVLFAYPLFKNQLSNARVKRLAIKSLIAAAASAIASSANLFTLSILSHGEQLSWECFAICTMDTLFNASVLFFITNTETSSEVQMTSIRSVTGGLVVRDGIIVSNGPSASLANQESSAAARRRSSDFQSAYMRDAKAFSTLQKFPEDSGREEKEEKAEGSMGMAEIEVGGETVSRSGGERGEDPALWRGDVHAAGSAV